MNGFSPSCQCGSMDTYIFSMNIDVNSVSAYILISALIDEGVKPSYQEISSRWPSGSEVLDKALAELVSYKISVCHDNGGDPVYRLNPPTQWRYYRLGSDLAK